ncbi:hypothetical protein RJ640_013864 [Escallonia rubra]|uniref:Integrase catalytic domain-containing protein n=1 Tax=Escallonia rubra TaxID=112253 RepID=A0AA88ULR4_9ASTE|nr:hypothetical protein RJ640_013864 [Escallonia rubra]
MDESVIGNIIFGHMSKIPVKVKGKGKGKILIKLKNGGHQFISNVYYVLEMKANILSMGQLLEKGNDIHMKDKCLKLLSTKNMVKGLPSIDQPGQLYEGCLVGKQHRHSFPKESISRAKAPLEQIHADVCGPIDPSSLEVFSTFKRFKALVEKQNGYQIKAMRSDRGGEFMSKEFKAFCEENGIRRPLTIPYSPQQNGVVERKNRSIVNMTRSMLKSKNLPKEFWAEAVDCAVYLELMSNKNRDVTFDEKSSWNWTDRDKEQYVFYPIDTDRKEVEEEPIEPVTPSSPVSPTQSSPSSSSVDSNCVKMFNDFKKKMAKEFEITDIGLMSYYLGIEVKQRDDGIFISQEAYAKEVLKRFNMKNCNLISIPIKVKNKLSRHVKEGPIDRTLFRSLVGSLRYLTCTRLDILYAVGYISQYTENLTTYHFKVAKRILRYLKGTIDLGIFYPASGDKKLVRH